MSILPALLVGSGLKPKSPLPLLLVRTSPGFIGREWIETPRMNSLIMAINPSPGFIGREWIETGIEKHTLMRYKFSRLYWSGVD